MVACFPEKVTKFEFDHSMSGLASSEKVNKMFILLYDLVVWHINLVNAIVDTHIHTHTHTGSCEHYRLRGKTSSRTDLCSKSYHELLEMIPPCIYNN